MSRLLRALAVTVLVLASGAGGAETDETAGGDITPVRIGRGGTGGAQYGKIRAGVSVETLKEMVDGSGDRVSHLEFFGPEAYTVVDKDEIITLPEKEHGARWIFSVTEGGGQLFSREHRSPHPTMTVAGRPVIEFRPGIAFLMEGKAAVVPPTALVGDNAGDAGPALVAGGAVLAPDAYITGAGVLFEGNRIRVAGQRATAAKGAAAVAKGVIDDFSGVFRNNGISVNTTNKGAAAMGGALVVKTFLGGISSTFEGNSAEAECDAGDAYAAGGGLLVELDFSLPATRALAGKFTNNRARSVASGKAMVTGGGAQVEMLQGDVTAVFADNMALAESTAGEAFVYGGGLSLTETSGVVSGRFTGNKAHARSEKGTASAYGGALALRAGDLTVTNALFENNDADAETPLEEGSGAFGGAIFMQTSTMNQFRMDGRILGVQTLTLAPESGHELVFRNNTADYLENAIHIGPSIGKGYVSGAASDVEILIGGAGVVKLYDPITVFLDNGKKLFIRKQGHQPMIWGGDNHFNVEGGTLVYLRDCEITLERDFTMRVGEGQKFELFFGGRNLAALSLRPVLAGRDPGVALFRNPTFIEAMPLKFAIDPHYYTLDLHPGMERRWLLFSGETSVISQPFTLVPGQQPELEYGLDVDGNGLYLVIRRREE